MIVRELQLQNGTPMGATPHTATPGDCGLDGPTPTSVNCDVAVFSDAPESYRLGFHLDGSITVVDDGGGPIDPATGLPFSGSVRGSDGTDTLWNIEDLRFCLATDAKTRQCTQYQDMVLAPQAAVFPDAYSFLPVAVGATSGVTSIEIMNQGTRKMQVTSVSLTGADAAEFSQSNSCDVVQPREFCFVDVTFSPSAMGGANATLHVETTDPAHPVFDVPLTGAGVADGPVIQVAPGAVDLFSHAVGTTSAPLSITVWNTGSQELVVTGAALIGSDAAAFAVSSACSTVAPGTSCLIDVAFSPKAVGAAAATLVVTSNDPTNPSRWVALSGTGVAAPPPPPPAPAVVVTGGPVAFGTEVVNVRTAPRVVRVTNHGNAKLVVKTVSVAGRNPNSFRVVNGCTAVAPGANCTLAISFDPLATGAKAATVVITTNAPNGTKSVLLSGVGVRPTTATLSHPVFGLVLVGGRLTRTVVVTNTGNVPLIVRSAVATGAFTVSLGTCASPVAPGAQCHLAVMFRPTSKIAFAATLRVVSNAINNPTVLLGGKGR